MSGGAVSDRILGYQPWIHEDPALIDLAARWRVMDAFGDYVQVLTLAVPPPAELGDPVMARDLARAANDELAELVRDKPDRFAGFSAAHTKAGECERRRRSSSRPSPRQWHRQCETGPGGSHFRDRMDTNDHCQGPAGPPSLTRQPPLMMPFHENQSLWCPICPV